MKIQRYIAKDMRSALAQVREALGADAVILSSGRIGEGVEVVAAIDFEAVQQAAASAVTANHTRAAQANTSRSALQIHDARDLVDDIEARVNEPLRREQDAQPPRQPVRQVERQPERRASSQISEELAPAFLAPPP